MKEHPEPWSDDEWEEYSLLFPVRMEEWIDAGNGECLLGCPENSKIVVECLRHFDGERYALDQFVVMPNHVHAIVAPAGSHSLSKITQTWKSFTSHEINKRLNRTGKLWQDESFDHIVRSAAQLDFYRKYIAENPVKAKLDKSRFCLGSGSGVTLMESSTLESSTVESSTGGSPVFSQNHPSFLQLTKITDGPSVLPSNKTTGGPPVLPSNKITGEPPVLHSSVFFREYWGTRKRLELLESLENTDLNSQYERAKPSADNRWSFRPANVAEYYLGWPKLNDLCSNIPSYGHMETRGLSLISTQKSILISKMRNFFDKNITNEEMKIICPEIMDKYCRYEGMKDRPKIIEKMNFSEEFIMPFVFKPFDLRFCYGDTRRPLWSEPSNALSEQSWNGNLFLISRMAGVKDSEGFPLYITNTCFERDVISGHARAIPFRLKTEKETNEFSLPGMEQAERITANLSDYARKYLLSLGFPNPDADKETAELVWMHALAIGYSPAYLNENADGIRQDWPRIPLPKSREILLKSSGLGRQIAALLDTENAVPGITAGKIREDIKKIAIFARMDGKSVQPDDGDLDITVGWGHGGQEGVTMPGKGKIVENGDTLDIYLNDFTCWRNVPVEVWDYTIGGYQVIKNGFHTGKRSSSVAV